LVNAAKNIELKAVQGFELFPSFLLAAAATAIMQLKLDEVAAAE
jgi:hypothetical protein